MYPTVNVFGVKDIPFKLKNNSMDLEKGRFGQGWSSNYDLNVKPQEDGALLVYTSNTSYIRFVNDNAKKGIINGNIKDSSVKINSTELLGTYSCLTTNYQRYKLTKELDRYFVTDDKGNSYYFNNEGKLNQTKDKKGRILEVSSEDKKITVKEKSTNKQIQTTSNDEGYITKIADNTGKESTLTYNEAGQIETITNAVGDKTRYEYDPEGRLIRQMINNSDVMTIKYDELGRVVSKTDAMGESITYSYDTKSEFWRTLINITDRNGNTEKIKADWRGHIVANKNALEEETYFTYNRYGDMTSVRDALGNSSIYEYDYRGSTTVITNQKSEITDVITYDAYGGISGRKGNTDTLFLYVGQQGVQTDDNGLYYMRGRYYNTDIHRFINLDPINDGLNWYGYVNGNPVMNVDPSGNSAMDSAQILTDLGFNARDIGVAVGGLVSVIITGEVLIVVGLVAAVVFIGYATLHGNPTVMAEAWDFKFTKVLSGGYIGDVWVHDTGQEYWVQTGGNEFTAGAKFDGQNVYYPDSPNDPNGKKPKGSGSSVPVKDKTRASNGLDYKSNPKHTPGQHGYKSDAGVEPRNSLDLFSKSVPSTAKPKQRYTYDKVTETLHRFFNDGNGEWHWSGSTNQGANSLTSGEVPIDIRRLFNLPGKGW